ncbi:PIG-L family deacetylase [Nocardia sp. CA2R105]|uniref:PIG-L deacetylase family protein n=1 Tax=Nocardia coffeae TaxID=2873381 RepID=UPI001CA69C3E|nr:PIG-L family deacetylase [Nocardia coffeae]MBY8859960.1 PIG-L family deacetylase [Nocardia coffeae]
MDQVPEDWQTGLVIVAHPGDIEYEASAAVHRWTMQGKRIRYVLASRGEAGIAGLPPGQTGPLREREQIAAAKVVGVQDVEFLSYPDGRIEDGLALRRDLARAIRRHRPEMVVLFNFHDTWAPGRANSADHRAVGRAALDAIADAANEWIFPELSGLPIWTARWAAVTGSVVTHAVDVTDSIKAATESILAHGRYLAALGPVPVPEQARAIVEEATAPIDGFPAERAIGFELFYGRG